MTEKMTNMASNDEKQKVARPMLFKITKALWIFCLIVGASWITSVFEWLFKWTGITFLQKLHNYIIGISQSIVCFFIILTVGLIIYLLSVKNLFSSSSFDEQYVAFKVTTKTQLSSLKTHINNIEKETKDYKKEVQKALDSLKMEFEYNKGSWEEKQKIIVNTGAESMVYLQKIAQFTPLETDDRVKQIGMDYKDYVELLELKSKFLQGIWRNE